MDESRWDGEKQPRQASQKKKKLKMPSGRFTLLLLSPAYAYLPPALSLRARLCRPTFFHSLFSALPALPLLLPSLPPSPSRRQSFPLPSCVSHCSHDSILLWISHAQTKQTKIASSCSRSSSCRFDAVGEFYGFLENFEKNFWLLLAETE